MELHFSQFIKDIDKIDLDDICSEWQWLLKFNYTPVMVSCSGDMFLKDNSSAIYWLDTGLGQLTLVSNSSEEFQKALLDLENFSQWLLPSTVLDLIEHNIILGENDIYSYKLMPILNGDYSWVNYDVTNISVHFSITGQISKQILEPDNSVPIPDDTKVRVLINPFIKT